MNRNRNPNPLVSLILPKNEEMIVKHMNEKSFYFFNSSWKYFGLEKIDFVYLGWRRTRENWINHPGKLCSSLWNSVGFHGLFGCSRKRDRGRKREKEKITLFGWRVWKARLQPPPRVALDKQPGKMLLVFGFRLSHREHQKRKVFAFK